MRRLSGVGLLCGLALVLYVAGIDWGWGSESLWSWDEPHPRAVLAAPYTAGASWSLRYPLLHRDLLRGLFFFVEPSARFLGLSDPDAIGRVLFLAGRLVTVLMSLLTLLLAIDTSRRLASRRAGIVAGWLWLVTLPQAYYAKTANLDGPYLFWFAAAAWSLVRCWNDGDPRTVWFFVLAASASVLTKDQAFGLFILPAGALVVRLVRGRGNDTQSGSRLVAFALATLAASMLAGASYRLWGGWGMLERHLAEVAAAPRRFAFVAVDLYRPWQSAQLALRHVFWSFSAPVGAATVFGAGFALARGPGGASRDQRAAVLLLFALSYAIFTLGPLGYNYDRFLLPICWVLAVLAGIGLDRVWEAVRGRALWRRALAVAAAIGIGFGLLRVLALDLAMLGDRRFELEAATRGRPRAAVFVHEVRAPQGFTRLRVTSRRSLPTLAALQAFEVVAIPRGDLGSLGLAGIVNALRGGACGFGETRPDLANGPSFHRWVDFRGVLSNLGEIDPPMLVFERQGPTVACPAEATRP